MVVNVKKEREIQKTELVTVGAILMMLAHSVQLKDHRTMSIVL